MKRRIIISLSVLVLALLPSSAWGHHQDQLLVSTEFTVACWQVGRQTWCGADDSHGSLPSDPIPGTLGATVTEIYLNPSLPDRVLLTFSSPVASDLESDNAIVRFDDSDTSFSFAADSASTGHVLAHVSWSDGDVVTIDLLVVSESIVGDSRVISDPTEHQLRVLIHLVGALVVLKTADFVRGWLRQ